jgi:hypothetical protein
LLNGWSTGLYRFQDDCRVSPTHSKQEMSVWNDHYACTCYHPPFQGQEAAVILISMATSSGDDVLRQIEFL